MVVCLPTLDGTVVVADKRTTEHNNVLGDSSHDNTTKIVRVSDRIGLFGLHTSELIDARTGESELNLAAVVQEAVKSQTHIDPTSVAASISDAMVQALRAFLDRLARGSWPRTTFNNEQEPVFYEVVIFYVESGEMKLLGVQLRYRGETGLVEGHQKLYPRGPYIFGGLRTCYKIIEGVDPAYSKYRADSVVERGCRVFTNREVLETRAAIQFAKRLIEIASTHERGISPTSDCAILRLSTGFDWCERAG
jgi:hypothetical protein